MKLKDILAMLNASSVYVANKKILEEDFTNAFSSDLMSDCLALLDGDNDKTILLTGLCNAQSIRTCEMLDLRVVIYVRGKVLNESDIKLASERDLNVFTTNMLMYEASAKLYNLGLAPAGK